MNSNTNTNVPPILSTDSVGPTVNQTLPEVVNVPKKNKFKDIILVSLIVLVCGIVGTIIIIRTSTDIQDALLGKFGLSITPTPQVTVAVIKQTVTPTQTINPTVTTNVVSTPIVVQENTYHSNELAISFKIPQGVVIKEVDDVYNPEGCLDGSVSLPYKAIRAYRNNVEILFLGVNGACGATIIGDGSEAVVFETTVSRVKYTLWSKTLGDVSGYMLVGIQFGSSSKVAYPKVRSNDAIMKAQTGAPFSRADFDAAVAIISSIVKD
jgi:hypothetical protein